MRLRFSARALDQLESIRLYLNDRNPAAAQRLIADIRSAARRLPDFPFMARDGVIGGTREWVVRGTPYILVYEVTDSGNELVVLAVFHGAQDRAGQPE